MEFVMISFLYQDKFTPTLRQVKKVKSAAQGLITLATYGVGMLVGFWVAGKISDTYLLENGGHNWEVIWMLPAAFAIGVLVLFMLIFKDEKIEIKEE